MTVMCFFLSQCFIALAVCFVVLEDPFATPLSFHAVKLTCPLTRKHPQSIMGHPPCLMAGFVVLVVVGIPLPPNTVSRIDSPELDLVSSDHISFSQSFSESFSCSLANFRRPGHSWAGGTSGLIPHLITIIDSPQGKVRGATERGILTAILCFFHFLMIMPTVVTHPASCQWSCSPLWPYAGLQSCPWCP